MLLSVRRCPNGHSPSSAAHTRSNGEIGSQVVQAVLLVFGSSLDPEGVRNEGETMRSKIGASVVGAVGVALALSACAEGVGVGAGPIPTLGSDGEEPPETSSGSTGGVSFGTQWCARVPNPVGTWMGGTPAPEEINEPEGGGDPEGCLCADQETHDFLTSILNMQSQAIVTTAHIEQNCPAFAFRQAVYIEARNRCEYIAEEEMNPTPDFYTQCSDNLDQDEEDMSNPLVTPLYQDGFPGGCIVGIDFGGVACSWEGPGDTWSDYYTLSNEIVEVHGTYWIDNDFYVDLKNNPAWLLTDGTRVKWQPPVGAAKGYWYFTGCTSGTICYALGIRNNDRPVSIDGMPLKDFDALLDAYEALHLQQAWTLVVKRGGSNVTLNYERPASFGGEEG